MLILDWPPHPLDPKGGARAYLLNVFVQPEYRRRGLARGLLELCVTEARRRNIRVVSLHASLEGVPLYEQLSFKASNEMLAFAKDGERQHLVDAQGMGVAASEDLLRAGEVLWPGQYKPH
jgi:ribosomal protein S18 acetylase RimI-like enzyme